jgi:hypothetical protein
MSLVTAVTARPRAAPVRSALFRADRARLAAAGWKAEPVDPVAPAPEVLPETAVRFWGSISYRPARDVARPLTGTV